jgi:hemerythrin-like domain-containing protein
MLDLKNYKEQDPLKRMVEKDSGGEEMSPMDPPEISDSSVLPTNYEAYHACLKQLAYEHKEFSSRLEEFEKAILFFKENGLQQQEEIKNSINNFFSYMDNTILLHNKKEEKYLFYKLNERLNAKEIYSGNESSNTVVDIMEDDHSKLIQSSALAFNLLGLATRLPDQNSRLIVLDIAIEQSLAMIELLKLHIYREDHIVFDLANEHLTKDELDQLEKQMK